jgi:hypothetical protein
MILVVFQNMDFLMHIPFMDTCQYAYIGSQHSPVSRWSPFFCHFLRIISMFHDRNFQRNWDSCVPTAGGGLTEAIFIAASEFLAIFEKWSRLSTALCAWRQQLLLLFVSGLQCALPTDGFFAIPTPERFCPQSLVAPSSAAPPATLPPPSGGLSAPSHSHQHVVKGILLRGRTTRRQTLSLSLSYVLHGNPLWPLHPLRRI